MGVKWLVSLLMILVLISACSIGKTKPVVTDITGEVVADVQEPEEEKEKENETTSEESEEFEGEETEESEEEILEGVNKTEELNESDEELPPGTHVVVIKNLKLDPKELTIKKGDVVAWKHEDEWEKEGETRHFLSAHGNEFRSVVLFYGDTFEHTFNDIGEFTYIDIIYKEKENLRGKIVVE